MDKEVKYRYVNEADYHSVAGPDWPNFDQFQLHVNVPDFVYDEIDTMLFRKEPFQHPTFCVLPFYGHEYPKNTPCCVMSSDKDIDRVKQEMLNGIRSPECNHCWRLEDAGIKSDRLIKNESLDFYTSDLEQLFNDCRAGKNKIIHYKIDASTVCNATCVTCGSDSSSAWAVLERKYTGITVPRKYLTNDEADQLIDYKSAVAISFRGGEPLLSDTNFYILEQLLKHNNNECFISYVTNGSIEIANERKQLLSKFKNVNFSFSIDGIGSVFEYMRYPLSWDKIQENIQFCRDSNILVSANYTASNINILYYNQTIKWFENNKIPYRIGYVENPRYFRPGALPMAIKQHLRQSNINLEIFLSHGTQDDVDFEEMKRQIIKQDMWKGISIQDYLPEFAQLIQG